MTTMTGFSRLLLASIAIATTVPLATMAYADDNKMSMDQLPKPTRDALTHEAQGGKVDEIDKLTDNGHLFVAEIKKGDQETKVYVDAFGKVIGQHTEKK